MDNSDSHIDKKIKLDNPDMSSSEQPKKKNFSQLLENKLKKLIIVLDKQELKMLKDIQFKKLNHYV